MQRHLLIDVVDIVVVVVAVVVVVVVYIKLPVFNKLILSFP